MKKTLTTCLLAVMFLFAPHAMAQPALELETEIQKYIKIFEEGFLGQQLDACNELQWAGLSDTRLFDIIEKKFIGVYPRASNKQTIDHAAWLAKALTASGQEKYLATLKEAAAKAPHRKLTIYINKATPELARYHRWNPIISDNSQYNADEPLRVNRFVNMLRSEEWDLKLIAAKRTHYEQLYNDYLLETIKQDLLQHYKQNHRDNLKVSVLKWYSKALAASGKHGATVHEVASSASNPKVRVYAKKINKKYQRP